MSVLQGRRERCHSPYLCYSLFSSRFGFSCLASRKQSVKGSGGRTQSPAPFNPLRPAVLSSLVLALSPSFLPFLSPCSSATSLSSSLLLPGRFPPFLDPFPHADPFPVS